MIHEKESGHNAGIVLATVNARYHHASLGLRYLMANMGDLSERCALVEITLIERPVDALERILSHRPSIVSLAVYVWNAAYTHELASLIRRVAPQTKIVLGGPEVSYPDDLPPVAELADHIVTGEGDRALPELCRQLLDGRTAPRIVTAEPPDLEDIALPYHLYDQHDIASRTLYLETTRGCPLGCEFCLSSLDKKVRRFPTDRVLAAIDDLWERGARGFKFVDRALNFGVSEDILLSLASRSDQGIFAHFELVPDGIPEWIFEVLSRFEPGEVQLEVGVQSLDPEITSRIGRRQDPDQVISVLRRLLAETGCHIHSDLVVGLPGESLEGVAEGFDRLLATGVHEIQVGILKRLRGAPISRHDEQWQMRYNPNPPYEILSNALIDFETMQHLKRFSRYFDLVHNSGKFPSTATMLLSGPSPFSLFSDFTREIYSRLGATSGISQDRMALSLLDHLTKQRGMEEATVAGALMSDYTGRGMRRIPGGIRDLASGVQPESPSKKKPAGDGLPARQRRHKKGRMDQ